MTTLTPLPPLDTAPLFPALSRSLISLLRSLEPADWDRATVAGSWRVRDVAAHVLDVSLRKVSGHRDGHAAPLESPIRSYADVMALIQRLNAGGVSFGARLSPRVLTDLLEVSGQWVSEFVAALDPEAMALHGVAWAGEMQSTNRFDTAREFTEHWHHQMQIRDALGSRGLAAVLLAREFFVPLLETSLRVLPHAYVTGYGGVNPADGTTVELSCAGMDLAWTLRREREAWVVSRGVVATPTARVRGTGDQLWRLFFNALPVDRARTTFEVHGPSELVEPLLRSRSVMV